jgi:pimeloyl-ACP methyl ester carboxylesterase
VAAIRRAALLLGVLAAGLALASPAQAALSFKRCGGYGFACARLSVPLDRSGAVPGRVSLFVERVRARQRGGATLPPLVTLAGGPGQSATDSFGGEALSLLYAAYAKRDLVVFDQRGTGRSGLLRCPRLERVNLLRAGPAAAACARSLGPRRAFYTSRDSTDDIDAIRRQLGARRLALFGTSYGTKVALAYAKRYPDRVERLVLDSVAELDGPDPYYLDTLEAVPRVLHSLCGRRCFWTGDVVAEVASLVDRLAGVRVGARGAPAPPRAGGGLRGEVVDARGRRHASRLTRIDLFTILMAGDFDPTLRAAFPGAVHSALGGDAAPLLRLRRRAFAVDAEPPPPRVLSSGVYAATTCEEVPMPWPRSTPPDADERHRQAAERAAAFPDSAFEPFDRATALASDTLELCESWPHAPAAPELGGGALPDVPVLLVEGADDLRTPLENAQRTAAMFPHSRLVVVPDAGHSAIGADFARCAITAFARFVQRRPVPPSCRRTRRAFPVTPPPPARLDEVRPFDGIAGLRGRTVGAVELTVRDVAEDSLTQLVFDPRASDVARGGGLRAGHYRLGADNTLELHGVSFVPGVTVTGRLRHFLTRRESGRLRIGGSAAAHGVLTIRRRLVSGRLGGRPLRAARRAPTAAAAVAAARRRPLARVR